MRGEGYEEVRGGVRKHLKSRNGNSLNSPPNLAPSSRPRTKRLRLSQHCVSPLTPVLLPSTPLTPGQSPPAKGEHPREAAFPPDPTPFRSAARSGHASFRTGPPTNLQTSTHLPNFITFYSSLHPASSTPPTTQPFTHSSTHSSNHKSSHPSIHNLSSLAPFIHHPFITQTSNYPSVSLLPFAYTSCHSHFQTYIHLGLSSSHPHTHLLLDSIKCKKLQ